MATPATARANMATAWQCGHLPGSNLVEEPIEHPRTELESRQARAEGHNLDQVLTTTDLVKGNNAYFVATGITDGEVLRGVRYAPNLAITQSLSMRSSSGAVRTIETKHRLSTSTLIPASSPAPAPSTPPLAV